MAGGMEMMMASLLKSMGVDPDAFKNQVEIVMDTVKQTDARLSRIEAKLDAVMAEKDLTI